MAQGRCCWCGRARTKRRPANPAVLDGNAQECEDWDNCTAFIEARKREKERKAKR